MPLADLVGGCAAGDARALHRLYDVLAPHFFGIALRIVGDARIAEDVLHDTFVQIWRQSDKFDRRKGTARGWMVSLLRYRAIAERGRRPGGEASAPSAKAFQATSGATVPPDAEERERVLRLNRCLGDLPEKPRRCIALAFLNGLPHDRIASDLVAPVATVKIWIRQGVMRLKECSNFHGQ